MDKTIRVKTDAYLLQSFQSLSQFTGKAKAEDVLGDAIILTAASLQKHEEGYIIQTIQQSIGQDRFSFPFIPTHIYQDMKRRPPSATGQELLISLSAETKAAMNKICSILAIDAHQDAIDYSMHFALLIATELRKSTLRTRLAYVDQKDRRFGIVVQTPYDRGLRNHFNRLLDLIQDKWKIRGNSGPGGNTPPNPPPYTV